MAADLSWMFEGMTDREKGDHWGQLASVLGAEVREEAPVDEVPQAQPEAEAGPTGGESPPEQTVPAPQDVEQKPPRPRPAANWDALASSLGIEPPPEPVEQPLDIAPAAQPAAPTEEQLAVSTRALAETVEKLSECMKAAPASLGHEPTVVIARETVAVFPDLGEEDVEESGEPGEGEEPARGRAKRRRRRRPRAGEKQAVPEDSDAVPSEATEPEEEVEDAEDESDEKRRSKRRRPRRRRQKSELPEAKASPKPEVASDEADEADDFDADDSQEADGEKSGHRSIPAWQEAVGFIVDKNLESRSTRPGGGQSPKRGGRRPGRRGGG